ncbi:hypothetical protein [Fusobacterium massiliense]|uniref:hypothetical protein n=1 Tax=Fusobacterium massiliense TaxID=1852365 RepID=UPI0028E5DB2D|nr:hypothetical protein [Fusobacterium massiliense]
MKKRMILIMGLLMSSLAFAHAPIISVDDNGDGTVYVEGGFSNGAPAEGVEIIVVKDKPYNGPEDTFKGKEIIYKGKLGSDNSITFPKPATDKYEVYFNAGEGHVIGKKGPTLTDAEKDKWNKAVSGYDFGDWKDLMMEK